MLEVPSVQSWTAFTPFIAAATRARVTAIPVKPGWAFKKIDTSETRAFISVPRPFIASFKLLEVAVALSWEADRALVCVVAANSATVVSKVAPVSPFVERIASISILFKFVFEIAALTDSVE